MGRIAERLIRHGRDPQTPAAMIQMAFWNDERVVTGPLVDIADIVQQASIKPPATLVIGKVVRLREKLKVAERDLRRRADGSSRFEPAPAPDQLMRLATAGLGSRVFGFALRSGLFDRLETTVTSAALLAEGLGLDAEALGEILESLVALGILERRPDGYRNLELASRYLREASPQSLKSLLMLQASQSADEGALARYAREGCREYVAGSNEEEHRWSCEASARFAAPAVVEKVDLASRSPILLVGWGGDDYRQALRTRWPSVEFESVNPFVGHAGTLDVCEALPHLGQPYPAVILSGLLASCNRGQVQKLLEAAVERLAKPGLLLLSDSFLPAGALPPPEVVLGALGRRMTRGGCRAWSIDRLRQALSELGLSEIHPQPLTAGNVLVTAEKV